MKRILTVVALVMMAGLSGCAVVPANGHGVYYEPAPYYGPRPYYGPPAVVVPGPFYTPRFGYGYRHGHRHGHRHHRRGGWR